MIGSSFLSGRTVPGKEREAMNIYKLSKRLAVFTVVLLFFWFFILKIVSRIAARSGKAAPCPASLAWIVNNPLRRMYMRPVLA